MTASKTQRAVTVTPTMMMPVFDTWSFGDADDVTWVATPLGDIDDVDAQP